MREFYELQSSYFDQNLSILCLPDDDVEYDMIENRPPIIGFNLMFVVKRNAPHFGKKVFVSCIDDVALFLRDISNLSRLKFFR